MNKRLVNTSNGVGLAVGQVIRSGRVDVLVTHDLRQAEWVGRDEPLFQPIFLFAYPYASVQVIRKGEQCSKKSL